MPGWVELILILGLPMLLLLVGRFAGMSLERRHFADITVREAGSSDRPAFTVHEPGPDRPIASASLAIGSVVVSVDHFKRFVSGFRMLFGGEVRSYSSLIDRARREALLRMKESHPQAHAYFNTRLETSTISSTSGDEGLGTIEVVAYGTAVTFASTDEDQLR